MWWAGEPGRKGASGKEDRNKSGKVEVRGEVRNKTGIRKNVTSRRIRMSQELRGL